MTAVPLSVNGNEAPPAERGMPIAWLLPLMLTVLVMVAVVPVVLLGYLGARDNTDRLMRDRSELVLDGIVGTLVSQLEQVETLLGHAVEAGGGASLDTRDLDVRRAFLAAAVAAAPQVDMIALALPDQSWLILEGGNWRDHGAAMGEQPHVRQAVNKLNADLGSLWFGPFWSPALEEPVIAFGTALKSARRDHAGALVAMVPIHKLSGYLMETANDFGQTPFVLLGRSRVLAHPELTRASQVVGRQRDQIPRIGAFGDRVLARIWSRQANDLSRAQPFRRSRGHWSWLEPDGFESNAYVYRALAGYGTEPWTVGFH
ncbi:hypothetical protein GTW51_06425 [Aurantimonas aggregata]|uniref:Double Cache domain-containing protein n=1 Tax=Aurantimonas aggregata TaxID=2047720 RepID=A0A6L9MEN3_9HYPH|nr:hypothetical protein [Aurantimonas aggregata]NDV86334.1 hypothetical protein [Aurantimonas aggregata]